MDSLLRWGIENSKSDGTAPPAEPREPLDPAIIDAILGKSDAQLMKEALEVAVDESMDIEARLTALDDFEMLVESIDNANNMAPLKMWEPIIALSQSSLDKIRMNALWVLGTSVQNNPTAQQTYLSYNPLPQIISILTAPDSSASPETRSKAVYCISNTLRHNANAVKTFGTLGGWDALKGALSDSSIIVRRKTAFLLYTLLLQDGPPTTSGSSSEQRTQPTSNSSIPIHTPSTLPAPHPNPSTNPNTNTGSGTGSGTGTGSVPPAHPSFDALNALHTTTNGSTRKSLLETGILRTLISSLANPLPYGPNGEEEGPDVDYEEKALRVVLTFIEMNVNAGEGGQLVVVVGSGMWLGDAEKAELGHVLFGVGKKDGLERWSLTESEWSTLEKASS